ncbi:carbohydrate ABC transporter permease [Candidatus Aerophobetes bacterium]|nr:carbohydrate ABC transporter permease [Candidatus Aerophobetes bacterium]
MKKKKVAASILTIVVLIGIILIVNIPIVWLIMTSFKMRPDIISDHPVWIFRPTLEHYIRVLARKEVFPVDLYFSNSLIVTISTTLLAILITFPAAYSIARFNTGGRNLSFWILSIRMLPPVVFLIPIGMLFMSYHLLDTKFGLIIVYLTFNIPFATWTLKSFIEEIPREIEESALIDGAGRLGVITRVTFPLCAPGLVAVSLICFIFSWNEFLYALVLTSLRAVTMTVGTARFLTGYAIWWGDISAAATVAMIPVIVLGFLSQKYLVRGLTLGAIK